MPGVEIPPLSCILQQADGKAGAGIDSFGGGHLRQRNNLSLRKVSVLNSPRQGLSGLRRRWRPHLYRLLLR